MGGQGCSCFSASGTLPHLQEGERGGQYSSNMWQLFLIQFITSPAFFHWTWPTVVTEILTMGWMIQSLNSGRSKTFFLFHYVKTNSQSHLAICSVGIGESSFGGKAVGVRLTTQLHLVPRVRISWLVLPLSLYAVMACTKTTIPLPGFISKHK